MTLTPAPPIPGPSTNNKSSKVLGVLLALAVAAIPATGTIVAATIQSAPKATPSSLPASQIVLADDLPDSIPAGGQGVEVRGRLAEALPSGHQLWSAQRQSDGATSDKITGPGFAVSELCDVAQDGKTFDCGFMQLGDDSLPAKRYVVYLGTADSSTARELVKIKVEQERDANWDHTVPRGFNAVAPQVVTRQQ